MCVHEFKSFKCYTCLGKNEIKRKFVLTIPPTEVSPLTVGSTDAQVNYFPKRHIDLAQFGH